MRITGLNHKITIQQRTITKSNGLEIENWTRYTSFYASINGVFGSEFMRARAIQEENTLSFTTHYTKQLSKITSKDFRIIYNNKVYDITYIDNVKYENKCLIFRALERDLNNA